MWLDYVLRRYGVILLILLLPGLVLPVVAIALNGLGAMSVASVIVIGLGYAGALALYGALAYFTVRALRR